MAAGLVGKKVYSKPRCELDGSVASRGLTLRWCTHAQKGSSFRKIVFAVSCIVTITYILIKFCELFFLFLLNTGSLIFFPMHVTIER